MKVKDIVNLARRQNGIRAEVYYRGKLIWNGDLRDFDKYQNFNIRSTGFSDAGQITLIYL